MGSFPHSLLSTGQMMPLLSFCLGIHAQLGLLGEQSSLTHNDADTLPCSSHLLLSYWAPPFHTALLIARVAAPVVSSQMLSRNIHLNIGP